MTTLKRFPDWQTRLQDFLEQRRTLPMCWGENDCALFVADAVIAMTGVDLAEGYRGRYHSFIGAYRLLRSLVPYGDLDDLAELVADKFALVTFTEILQARRGDLVLSRTILGAKLGVVWDSFAYSPGRTMLSRQRVDACCRGWRI